MPYFSVWVTSVSGEANQSLLFVLQTALRRSEQTKLFGNKVCSFRTRGQHPTWHSVWFWRSPLRQLGRLGGVYTPRSYTPVLWCSTCLHSCFSICCYKVLSPRVLDLLCTVFIWLFEVSEERLAFGAASSIICYCPGNGLSFEYVNLRCRVCGSVGIPTVLPSVSFLGKKSEL